MEQSVPHESDSDEVNVNVLQTLLKQFEESRLGSLVACLDPRVVNNLRELIKLMERHYQLFH